MTSPDRTPSLRKRALALAAVSLTLAPLAPLAPSLAQTTAPRASNRYGDGGVSAFYGFDGTIPAAPGTMVRMEPLPAEMRTGHAGSAWRILYSSTNGVGEPTPVVVSGSLFFPTGEPPKAGWPIVSWAHGTTGVADVCAPSWQGQAPRDQAFLDRWLAEGFAVVATDYQGLGTPGPHPYLLYRPEAYSVLDSVRAVLGRYEGTLRNRVLLTGFSQGSGAALGAGSLAPRYAPDVDIIGVLAIGVVGGFEPQPHPGHPPEPWTYPTPHDRAAAYVTTRLAGAVQAMHPTLDIAALVNENGQGLVRQSRTACLGDMVETARAGHLSDETMFKSALGAYMAQAERMSLIPNAKLPVPVFVATGLADNEAGIVPQYNAVAAMCDAGTPVVWERYPGLTHRGSVNAALRNAVPFAKSLLAGRTIAGNCAALSKVGPLQKPLPGVPYND